MKNTVLSLFFLITGITLAQPQKTHWQLAQLKGKVKTVRTIEHFPEQNETKSWETNFNTKGYVTDVKALNEQQMILNYVLFEYDKHDNQIGTGTFTDKGGSAGRSVASYQLGNKTEETFYDENGALKQRGEYVYDKKRNLIEASSYFPDGLLLGKIKYIYDSKGNNTERLSYDPEGVMYEKSVYKYDAKGNVIEIRILDGEGLLLSKYLYKYDKQGNPIEELVYGATDDILLGKMTTNYEYDSSGNWVRKIVTSDNKPVTISEQQIEYY